MYKNFFILFSLLAFLASGVSAQSDIVSEAPNDTVVVKQDLAKNAEFFSKGLEAKYNENYPVATENFEQALKFYSEDDASMYELSMLYQMDGRNTEAFSMIKRAAELQPDNKWYQVQLAQMYLQNSDYQSFVKIYDKLIQDEPENLDYLGTYIDVLLRIGDFDKVLEKLDIVEQQLGKNEYIYLQRVQIYDQQGKKDEALKEMEKLVEYMPENTQYMAMLAEAYRKVKRNTDAYKLYVKIKKLDPDNKYINISLMDYYLSVDDKEQAYEEFLTAIQNKNLEYDTKVQLFAPFIKQYESLTANELMKIGNTFIEVYPEKPVGYNLIGTQYLLKGDYVNSKEYFAKAVKYGDTEFATFVRLAQSCGMLGDYQDLVTYTGRAIELYPSQPFLYQLNAVGYEFLEDYEHALISLERGRPFVTEQDMLLTFDINLSDCYYKLNNKEKLYETYDRILRYDSENVYVLNNYAYYLSLDNKELERALQMSEKTIKAEPKNATYLDTYAWVLYKLGRYQEAKKYMDKVFKYDKKANGTNYEHFGDILYKLGDTKGAVKNWKKAQKAGGEVSEYLEQKIKEEKLYE